MENPVLPRQQSDSDRVVKGIWIPIDIWDNDELSMIDKFVYAIIDSFCNDAADCFAGNDWLAKKLHVSVVSVSRSVSTLKKRGLIVQNSFDGKVRHLAPVLSNRQTGLINKTKQSCQIDKSDLTEKARKRVKNNVVDTAPSTPISKAISKTDDKHYVEPEERFDAQSPEVLLSEFLFKKIQDRNPDHKKPNIQSWARDIDLLLRVDKRDRHEVALVITWCQADTFWQNNILSTKKLRSHYDRLNLQRKTPERNRGHLAKGELDVEKYRRMLANPPESSPEYQMGLVHADDCAS